MSLTKPYFWRIGGKDIRVSTGRLALVDDPSEEKAMSDKADREEMITAAHIFTARNTYGAHQQPQKMADFALEQLEKERAAREAIEAKLAEAMKCVEHYAAEHNWEQGTQFADMYDGNEFEGFDFARKIKAEITSLDQQAATVAVNGGGGE